MVVLCSLAGLAQGSNPYLVSLERWRADHESALRADDGWLTVVGLGWLKDGANRAGSATDADVKLPAGAPDALGVFRLAGGTVTFEPSAGVAAEINGQPASRRTMRPDADRLTSGGLSLFVIERGEKFGIKAENPPCAVTEFATFPLPPKQNLLPIRIEAGERYTPHP